MNYAPDDLFDNAWNNDDSKPPGNSAYVQDVPFLSTTNSILRLESPPSQDSPAPAHLVAKAPDSYKAISGQLRLRLVSATDLESLVFGPLIEKNLLSSLQASRIVDTLYEHDLLPATNEANLFQTLGLIALELATPGSGDYVTLQFKLNSSLPQLPHEAVAALLNSDSPRLPESLHSSDPLSAQLAATSIAYANDDVPASPDADSSPADNMLADHSNLLLDPDATLPESTHVNDYPYIMKHISDLRDSFKPLVGSADAVRIKEVPEKEGLVFKHTNYAITHDLKLGLNSPSGSKKVTRRYSDFVWLLEFLLKKYPFRVIPGLPPKKFTGMFPLFS